jgi:hypothetical protein
VLFAWMILIVKPAHLRQLLQGNLLEGQKFKQFIIFKCYQENNDEKNFSHCAHELGLISE